MAYELEGEYHALSAILLASAWDAASVTAFLASLSASPWLGIHRLETF